MILTIAFCAISIVVGGIFFWLVWDDPNPKVPYFSGLIFGFLAAWLAHMALLRWRK